jgi:opacity protein-like surface antigen
MKRFLMGAVGALAMATPSTAIAETSGVIGFSYNSLDDDLDPFKEDYLSLTGALATTLSPNWTLQFDTEQANMNHDGHSDNISTTTAHAFMRNESWAVGGFAGFTGGTLDGYVIGAEGALYFDRITLRGSAFLGGDREQDDTELNGFSIDGTYFVTDNFSVTIDSNWYEFDVGLPVTQDGVIYGIAAEYQFAGSPFSVFGGFHTSDETYFLFDKEADSITLGVRYNFGTPDLRTRDRTGASMIGASHLTRSHVFGY